jgi:hypothetical protein
MILDHRIIGTRLKFKVRIKIIKKIYNWLVNIFTFYQGYFLHGHDIPTLSI